MFMGYPVISCGEDTQYIEGLQRGLFAASSYAGSVINPYVKLERIPEPTIPKSMTAIIADWGGYRVVKDWAGKAPFTPEQYMQWLHAVRPMWAATWDYPCGDELGRTDPKVVQQRQDKSTMMAWFFWVHYQDCPWTWTPTVQGWVLEDYQRHAQDLYPLVKRMQAHYGPGGPFCVGIGSLVKRNAKQVRAIVDVVAEVLTDVDFHIWGGWKLSVVDSPVPLHKRVRSGDSSAFNGRFGSDLERDKGRSEPQRKVVFQENLPEYAMKMQEALSGPKYYGGSLFDGLETQDAESIA